MRTRVSMWPGGGGWRLAAWAWGGAGLAGAAWLCWSLRRRQPRLTIHVVTGEAECDALVRDLRRRCRCYRTIGFDCEWVTEHGKRRPVAVLQLASPDGLCGLFRLTNMMGIPDSLKELLEDEYVYKIGVVPMDDAKYLLQDYCVELKSTLDIRHIVQMCGYKPGGLANLAKDHLGLTLDKHWRIRCSDWEAESLSDRQQQYAAMDAYVAVKIFVNIIEQYDKQKRFILLRYFNNNSDCWKNIDFILERYADLPFKAKKTFTEGEEIDQLQSRSKGPKPVSFKKHYPHSTRSKPLYHNCFMLAPDGELLCTCDNKKAQWYVDRGLADIVNEEPFTVQLRFEPAARSVGEVGRYYQLKKENRCVVCGKEDSYIRKNVVPREYRKFFPEIMKDHSSHDVLLLCVSCHQRSNMYDQAVRNRLASRCDAPLSDPENDKYFEDVDTKSVRSAARALLHQTKKHNLPEARQHELERVILRQFPTHHEVTEELLQEACQLQVAFENIHYESHGSKVVDYYVQHEGGLLNLEKLWREHFLSTMRPNYMPELWSVSHNEERLMIRVREGRINQADMKTVGLGVQTF